MPDWARNLQADPRARVHVGAGAVEATAREATGPEREELWHRLVTANPRIADAERKAGRTLPVVVLSRI